MTEGSEVYADFVKSMLDTEDSRKSSLEQRGIAIVTTSGTLVTLLFGLTAAITGAETFTFPAAARDWLTPAAILFVIAAAAGIAVNVPLFYGKIDVDQADLEPVWDDNASDARAAVSAMRLKRMRAAQGINSAKAWILVAGTALELAAVAMLTVGIINIIQSQLGDQVASTSKATSGRS